MKPKTMKPPPESSSAYDEETTFEARGQSLQDEEELLAGLLPSELSSTKEQPATFSSPSPAAKTAR